MLELVRLQHIFAMTGQAGETKEQFTQEAERYDKEKGALQEEAKNSKRDFKRSNAVETDLTQGKPSWRSHCWLPQ